MKTWQERLTLAMENRNMRPSHLASMVKVAPASVKTKNIDGANLLKVCNALRISAEWLINGTEPSGLDAYCTKQTPAPYGTTSDNGVPVISWVQAGEWCDPGHVWDANTSDEWRPCPVKHSPHTVAIVVRGDSMWPEYPEGVDIFVDPSLQAHHNDDVVVRDAEGKATLKRLKITPEGKFLEALNPDWPNRFIKIPEGSTICGVVIYSGRKRK